MTHARTLYDKVWDSHTVTADDGGPALVYIDLHLVHEVTSPQAFEGLRTAKRKVRRPDLTWAVADHNVPTTDGREGHVADPESRAQLAALDENARGFGVGYFPLTDERHGIVHVIGPEQGLTQPGKTIVCGDSHTSTHGAFGALAFGIGTSDVEHVLATQTLRMKKSRNMRVTVEGKFGPGVTAKDLALVVIGRIGTAGGTGYVVEYQGEAVRALSMEGRMTLCNMTIEAGARAGLVAPDDKTFAYLQGRPHAPQGGRWTEALAYWRGLVSDPAAQFDREVVIDAASVVPHVTWGTSPEDVAPITAHVPMLDKFADAGKRTQVERALAYMGLGAGQDLDGLRIDKVFLGSCTNGRIEDLRAAAEIMRGRTLAQGVVMLVVPGSDAVRRQAESEGLHDIFRAAGAEWRKSGCSMCLAMNPDVLGPGERCASTSNRNFEGRQGRDGRTHLVSPAMAAAAAVTGHLTDVRRLAPQGDAR
ncbi:MAG: 3-isopropylmalate dehydratase large subunit [Rhodospirillaceae bacterium]|nr:3-isopropylmalate dehydratase large subunit [Rhodospirillaceae bacterium]